LVIETNGDLIDLYDLLAYANSYGQSIPTSGFKKGVLVITQGCVGLPYSQDTRGVLNSWGWVTLRAAHPY